jgi:hypothetical protein
VWVAIEIVVFVGVFLKWGGHEAEKIVAILLYGMASVVLEHRQNSSSEERISLV